MIIIEQNLYSTNASWSPKIQRHLTQSALSFAPDLVSKISCKCVVIRSNLSKKVTLCCSLKQTETSSVVV